MSLQKHRILMKSFFTSQFNYCPIVWICHKRSLNNKVNHIHEKALCIVYQDFQSRISIFLVKDNSFTIYQRNLQKHLQKCCILMKSFITLQFNYCPIVLMCHSTSLNNKVNHIHVRVFV